MYKHGAIIQNVIEWIFETKPNWIRQTTETVTLAVAAFDSNKWKKKEWKKRNKTKSSAKQNRSKYTQTALHSLLFHIELEQWVWKLESSEPSLF